MKNNTLAESSLAIKLTNVTKEYAIHHEKPTLVEKFIKGRDERFIALNNINLTIKKGERVGIIGPNGSGKTTLLKIITGITTPTRGTVETNGKIVSLIDLEAGFHPDLTGEQNIYINGMLLGLKKKEITKKLRSIITFSGIRQFIDVPLFTYSDGMKLRLGFSVVVHTDPDILILDETMSVGDKDFQNKSLDKIEEFFHKGKTILVVSHWIDFIKANCDRILITNKGTITHDGTTAIINKYKTAISS